MESSKTKQNICPNCGKKLNIATSIGGNHKPSPNDITVCIECATIMTFTDDMSVIKCPQSIIERLSLDSLLTLRFAVKTIMKMKKPSP